MSEDRGRPSKFKEEYTQELIDYFKIEPYREVTKSVVTKQGDVVEVTQPEANDFPTLAGFACKIKVHRDTLQEWSSVHEEFSVAYKMAKQYQEHFLATNGLKGLVNTAFGIFTAKNVIGWRDKSDLELTGKDGGPIKQEIEVERVDLLARVKQLKGDGE